MPKKRVSQAKRKNSAANGVKENGTKSKTNGTVQTNGVKEVLSAFDALELEAANASQPPVYWHHTRAAAISRSSISPSRFTARSSSPTQRSSKSTLLSALGKRELEIPRHVDIFHLTREMEASDKTALESVKEVDQEKMRLEKEAEELAHVEGPEAEERLMDIYERLDDLEADTAEMRAARILNGLGFSKDMMHTKTRTSPAVGGCGSP
ncbi:putative ATP-binding cassette sub-family F member 2 [Apostichopus japonicus]|uniref:Putative ATP-binding cassette sub-family F member 2 n=1 Tax=Stichopus japonicus TaxID=307972 RepID=A0A2G8L0T7_STIJA|nr:putative ATP-binding cassette sub-family F member 2 [Apostichopus japonicus]